MAVASTNDFGTVSAIQLSGPCTVKYSSNLIGLQSVYLSASSEAHFGSSSLRVSPGTTVYGFAVLGSDVKSDQVRGWTLISGSSCKQGAIYRVGSKTPNSPSSTTTFTINLPLSNKYNSNAVVLFKRAGDGVGSWSIDNHGIKMTNNRGYFYQDGRSVYFGGNGASIRLGWFDSPANYTFTFTVKNSSGTTISWNSWDRFRGPYTITATTTLNETTTT